MKWTPAQAITFAPDAATGRRGRDLATIRKWRGLAGNERAVWGECQSSGASYYKTQIDLQGPAFKCNCPSRKFPCKHGIGLFLLAIENSDAFRITPDQPDWVAEWLNTRGSKASDVEQAAKDAAAKAKSDQQKERTWQKRLKLMGTGLEDLELWLTDRIREGLANTQGQAYSFWQNISTRMVDSKLGGLGRRINSIPLLQGANTEWPERMLSEFAQLYLVIKGFKNLTQLPPLLQTELLNVAGVNTQKSSLLENEGIVDDWLVMGVMEGVDDNLNFRRVWIQGSKSEQIGLLLDYSFGDVGFGDHYATGASFRGEMVYYPARYPLRALLKEDKKAIPLHEVTEAGLPDFNLFFKQYAKAVTANPWLMDFPCWIEEVIPVIEEDCFYLIDRNRRYVKFLNKNNSGWKILSLSGGHPIAIFGEWTGEMLVPLSMLKEGRFIAL